jgi:hypothetical protein
MKLYILIMKYIKRLEIMKYIIMKYIIYKYIRRSRVQDPAAEDNIFLLELGMEII